MEQALQSLDFKHWVLILVIVGLVLVLLGWWFGGRRPHNSVSIKNGSNYGTIDQSDNSVRQTNITAKVSVHQAAAAASPRPAGNNDEFQLFQFLAVVVLALGTPLYVRYFQTFAVVTQILYLLAVGASLGLALLAVLGQLGRSLQVISRAGFLLLVSAAGAGFLLDAQSLLDPRVGAWAQQLPMRLASVPTFFTGLWQAQLFVPTLVSAAICCLCALLGFSVLRQLYRVAYAGWADAEGLDAEVATVVMPKWSFLGAHLGLMLALVVLRFYMLPLASSVSLLR